MSAIRGSNDPAPPGRLSIEHLHARDRALRAVAAAVKMLEELEAIERGEAQTETSPRLASVREIRGEIAHLGTQLDRTYV
jgi:hypothetical protein